jgi:hypothetical protein
MGTLLKVAFHLMPQQQAQGCSVPAAEPQLLFGDCRYSTQLKQTT